VQTAREGPYRIGFATLQADALKELLNPAFKVRKAVQASEEAQIFDGIEVPVQISVVREKSDMPAGLFRFFVDVDTFNRKFSVRGPHKRSSDFQKGRFTCAVPAEQRNELAALHRERHATECCEMAERFPDIL
jgi:hypothetical protein